MMVAWTSDGVAKNVKTVCILKVASVGFVDTLDMGCKRKIRVMVTGPQSVCVPDDASKG